MPYKATLDNMAHFILHVIAVHGSIQSKAVPFLAHKHNVMSLYHHQGHGFVLTHQKTA